MTPRTRISSGAKVAAGVALVFGALTIVSGGAALFGAAEVQAVAGRVVPFVLWFNFLSGFVYILAAVGIGFNRQWSIWLSTSLAVAILAILALFGWHVLRGGAYEMRTVGAMVLRSFVWIAIAAYLNLAHWQHPPRT